MNNISVQNEFDNNTTANDNHFGYPHCQCFCPFCCCIRHSVGVFCLWMITIIIKRMQQNGKCTHTHKMSFLKRCRGKKMFSNREMLWYYDFLLFGMSWCWKIANNNRNERIDSEMKRNATKKNCRKRIEPEVAFEIVISEEIFVHSLQLAGTRTRNLHINIWKCFRFEEMHKIGIKYNFIFEMDKKPSPKF